MAAPDKAQQDAEGLARIQAGVQPGDAAHALDVIDADTGVDAPLATTQPGAGEGEAPQRPLPPVKSLNDSKRDAIISKFRVDRTIAADEQRDDISDFTRSGMPPEFAENNAAIVDQQPPLPLAQDQPVAELQPDAAAPGLPAKIKIKVRGEEREVSLDELIAKGQIAYAADNYLDEAKSKLGEVDALLRQTRQQPQRAGQDPQHPEAPQRAQATEPGATGDQEPQHPEDRLGALIESIQFGNPEEAATLLRNTIAAEAQTVVTNTLEQQRFQDEGARTSKVLKDFETAHPDIASDSMARAAIERKMLDLQVEDIKALGIDPATLRPDGQPPTPGDIALAHRWYRTKGFKVQAPSEMLETATKNYLEWKGVKPAPTPAVPATPGAQPRIDVTVDRTARRAAIPQQPNRTAAPNPGPQAQQPVKPRDRSAIVQGMTQQRNAPRGRVTA